ncbi:MAG: NAD(P)H-dependent oxidoreductase [Alphaproteobacteria bacterium]|nr:NAD(P)H-dependent oxidoreductase [Alphaproteobacteria bacterium]
MKVLFVNACVRSRSRTKILADYLIEKLGAKVDEINLNEDAPKPFDEMMLEKRDALIKKGQFDNKAFDYAKRFADADMIIIAAPFWDFSFPALLKTFIEHVNVSGIVFKYTDTGIQTLCKASKLYYVTTMGGYNPTDYGFGYIKALCGALYGIDDVRLIKAEGLDIVGNDVDEIMEKAKKEIDKMVG